LEDEDFGVERGRPDRGEAYLSEEPMVDCHEGGSGGFNESWRVEVDSERFNLPDEGRIEGKEPP
jgi:hypothetical protein